MGGMPRPGGGIPGGGIRGGIIPGIIPGGGSRGGGMPGTNAAGGGKPGLLGKRGHKKIYESFLVHEYATESDVKVSTLSGGFLWFWYYPYKAEISIPKGMF